MDDLSTNDVIDWLRYYNEEYLRISEFDEILYDRVIITNKRFEVILKINDVVYQLSNFKGFWYRRSHFKLFFKGLEIKSKLDKELNRHLFTEAHEIHKLVKTYIEIRSINKQDDIYLNKLDVLRAASELGIKIPNSIVTNNKKDLMVFYNENKQLITKNFSQGIFVKYRGMNLGSSTKFVDSKVIEDLPDLFHYSLFQEMINKLFEVRVFFINNQYYASAIFSQNSEKTKLDFRNYDRNKPNRTPPFKLPKNTLEKLKLLMKEININSGSIDLIVSTSEEFIFLEVNPIGQFSQVSLPCNYYLEKEIAKQLINNKNGFNKVQKSSTYNKSSNVL